MHFISYLLPLAIATGVLALPVEERAPCSGDGCALEVLPRTYPTGSVYTPTPIGWCLQPPQATAIVNAFNFLLANPGTAAYNATVQVLLSSDFTDTSDSINQLAGVPEGAVTFPSKQAFISGAGAQGPLVLSTLDIFNSCNKIAWRWISVTGTGNNVEKVKGIDTFTINWLGQIEAVYSEFNSGAWLNDIGNPECIGK